MSTDFAARLRMARQLGEPDTLKLFTVTVESSELQDDWNDLYYVAARDEAEAKALAESKLRFDRPGAGINTEATEAHEYRGEAKVLNSFNPDEED